MIDPKKTTLATVRRRLGQKLIDEILTLEKATMIVDKDALHDVLREKYWEGAERMGVIGESEESLCGHTEDIWMAEVFHNLFH